VRARIETPDAEAALRVKETIQKALALLPAANNAVRVTTDLGHVDLNATPQALSQIVASITGPMRAGANQTIALNSLKQVGLAMHNYFATHRHLPPRCLTDKQGKPLWSWRVTLLPYLEQQALHSKLRLDQPFDSDANQQLAATKIPPLCEPDLPNALSRIRVPVFPGSLWHGDGPPKSFRDVIDGTANTIAAIHAPAAAAVNWADPQPWVLSEDDPAADVFGDRNEVAILFLDGSARVFTRQDLDNKKLKAMLTCAGREVME
jgi:hypothetical protein